MNKQCAALITDESAEGHTRKPCVSTEKVVDLPWSRIAGWEALTRYLDDGNLPPDNNHVENQIRPIAVGRSNWLFAGSLRAGQRAAAVMSLIQSAKLNGHDPYIYLKDVFTRLPTQPQTGSTNYCRIAGGFWPSRT